VVEVGAQLGPPGVQRPPEPGQLADRAVTQVGDQGCGAGAGEVGIVEPVKAHQVLGDGPGQGDLAVGVTGDQPGLQPGPGLGREPVAAAPQDPTDAEQRIPAAAAMPRRVLLDAAADVVHAG